MIVFPSQLAAAGVYVAIDLVTTDTKPGKRRGMRGVLAMTSMIAVSLLKPQKRPKRKEKKRIGSDFHERLYCA